MTRPLGETYVPDKPCKHGHWLRFKKNKNCVECNRRIMENRYANYGQNWHYKTNYNITKAEFDQMVFDAYSCCEICKRNDVELHLDHCHATGVNRGVLCGNCNRALGIAKDDPELLRKMASYLEERKNVNT